MPVTCNKRFSVPIHPSVKIGGFTIGTCENEVLPGMVVCEHHADPAAVRMLVEGLVRDLEEARSSTTATKARARRTRKPAKRST